MYPDTKEYIQIHWSSQEVSAGCRCSKGDSPVGRGAELAPVGRAGGRGDTRPRPARMHGWRDGSEEGVGWSTLRCRAGRKGGTALSCVAVTAELRKAGSR